MPTSNAVRSTAPSAAARACASDIVLRAASASPRMLYAKLLPITVIMVHALKNAMIPFVTMAAIQFGYMIGIQVTIEYIFAVPGMGSAVLNAVVNRDFPVIQGFTLVISAFFLFANIMADLFYALLDPRIRY